MRPALLLLLASTCLAHDVGGFSVRTAAAPFRLEVTSRATGRTLLPMREGLGFLRAARGKDSVKFKLGRTIVDSEILASFTAWDLESESPDLVVRLREKPDGPVAGRLTVKLSSAGEGALAIDLTVLAQGADRVMLAWPSPASESFVGLGERYDRVRQDGRRVPAWVSEQGIGRSEHPWLPFTGHVGDSYFPVPFLMSTQGHGVLVESFARSEFDVKVTGRPDRVGVTVWEPTVRLVLFDGPKPADVVRRLTARTGRPRRLPDWAFGTWLGVQGGPARVRQHLANVRGAGAPVDAIWAQDWTGARTSPLGYDVRYRWTPDEGLYPNLGGLIAELHASGVKFLTYFNTFLEPEYPEFARAASEGWLVRGKDGKPFTTFISTFKAGILDLSHPGARAWMAGYLRRALALGIDGWMADFGEWLPWDAKIAAPEGAPRWHNRYPVEWARLNREAGLAERPGGDFVIFARSGFAHSGHHVDLVWGGDQNTSWKPDDGLPSVVPAGLSLGLSGLPLFHFDAGGYTSLVSFPRNEELFMRWIEAAAMSPTLRTHEGYWRQRNVQADSSPKVLAHFAAMAKLHARLKPAIVAAAAEASATGLPIMRHLWLENPDDATALTIEDQWLLGPRWLAAPVLARKATARRVYLPRGRWKHWQSGEVRQGPAWHDVPAPMGVPALFEKLTE
jgi:alpha-glucosidase